jgi:uncharacterized protein YkwD
MLNASRESAAFRTSVISRGVFAAVVTIAASVIASQAGATDLGPLPEKSKGGGPFRIMCNPGDHVVGIDTRATHVIDFIAPVCGNRIKNATATYGRPSAGGKAGTLRTPRCPQGAIMTVLHVHWDNTPLVNRVGFACWNIHTNQMTNSLPDYGGKATGNQNLACPKGEVAVGIFGRAGTAIDALGLVCEKWRGGTPGDASEQVSILTKPNPPTAKPNPPPATPGGGGTDTAAVGGPGGRAFRQQCPKSHPVLVGFKAQAGAWVDGLTPLCSRPDGKGFLVDRQDQSSLGGKGGKPRIANCVSQGDYVESLTVTVLQNGMVNSIAVNCRKILNSFETYTACLDTGQGCGGTQVTCGRGQAAIGVHGRHGLFIDAVGLICGPIPGAAPTPPDRDKTKPLSPEAQAWLNAHNNARSNHCAPAMTWSETLAAAARAYASKCSMDHLSFEDRNRQGENLAWGEGLSAENAVKLWYDEVNRYDFNNPMASYQLQVATREKDRRDGSKDVGHFTQVVWLDTTEVGCGSAACVIDGKPKTMHVCRYLPSGNFNVSDSVLRAKVLPLTCNQRRRPPIRR